MGIVFLENGTFSESALDKVYVEWKTYCYGMYL
jgi:hypothetical protein